MNTKTNDKKKIIITLTEEMDSFDPLNADKLQNIGIMRSIYAQPFEFDHKANLSSQLLENYEYNELTNEMVWELKKGSLFENGEAITTGDIVLNLLRVFEKMPDFPVVQSIIGISDWAKSKDRNKTLPKGLVYDDSKIWIYFKEKVSNPFFRFSLEIFSIIPKSCIDKHTFQLSCTHPPESGYYKYEEKTKTLIKRKNKVFNSLNFPNSILLEYKKFEDLKQHDLDQDTVITARSDLINTETLQHFHHSDDKIYNLPASSMLLLLLNPTIYPFNDKVFRSFFAKKIIEELSKTDKFLAFKIHESFFTELIPGYLERDKFKNFPELEIEIKPTQLDLYISKNSINSHVYLAIENALIKIKGITINKINIDSKKESYELFRLGKSFFMVGATGFWDKDPIGDLKMFFTPNLHPTLNFISNDKTVREFLDSKLKIGMTPKEQTQILSDFNLYLSEDSKIFSIGHVRGMIITKKSSFNANLYTTLRDAAGPYWQLFNME